MYKQIWNSSHASVCQIAFYAGNGIKSTSVTGFKVDGFVVTDEFVYREGKFDYVTFRFVKEDGCSIALEVKMNYDKFLKRILPIVRDEEEGFALIDVSGTKVNQQPNIRLASSSAVSVGQSVSVLGYHCDQDNLSLRQGLVSSFIHPNNGQGKEYIQFNASIKQGNSGSPLIRLDTGDVIGVVGYRLLALHKEYDHFKQIIDENLRVLKEAEGKSRVGDLDPIQVLIANQHQLRQLGKELYKLSHSSYGFAHKIDNLSKYLS